MDYIKAIIYFLKEAGKHFSELAFSYPWLTVNCIFPTVSTSGTRNHGLLSLSLIILNKEYGISPLGSLLALGCLIHHTNDYKSKCSFLPCVITQSHTMMVTHNFYLYNHPTISIFMATSFKSTLSYSSPRGFLYNNPPSYVFSASPKYNCFSTILGSSTCSSRASSMRARVLLPPHVAKAISTKSRHWENTCWINNLNWTFKQLIGIYCFLGDKENFSTCKFVFSSIMLQKKAQQYHHYILLHHFFSNTDLACPLCLCFYQILSFVQQTFFPIFTISFLLAGSSSLTSEFDKHYSWIKYSNKYTNCGGTLPFSHPRWGTGSCNITYPNYSTPQFYNTLCVTHPNIHWHY